MLVGCYPVDVRDLPSAKKLAQGLADVLIDTGLYGEVTIEQIVGQHYRPGDDVWDVIACYRFSGLDGAVGRTCLDSFQAMPVDNGSWILSVRLDDIYRWRAMSFQGSSAAAEESGGVRGEP